MPSHAEATPQATCRATTKAGAPCRKQAVVDGLCTFHSGKLDLAELGRRGGKARAKKEEQPGDKLEALAHAAIEKLLTGSGSATAQAQVAKLVIDRISSNSPLSAELARRAIYAEQEAQREAALPAAREKLARLIEGKVKELADAMTEEQIAERVERRAEEMAAELYAERMRAETEAMKAEFADAPAADGPPAG
jgi:ATP-dependent Lon protease